jgi:predicted Na+-dependent transporter
VLPLYAGKALGRWRADVADRIERPLRRIVAVITVMALAVFVAHSGLASVELLGDRGWLAVIGVVVASLALGWLLGGSTQATRRSVITVCMSRNLALALLIARLSFPGRNVELAVFGVWWVLLGVGYLFALRRPLG